MQKTLNQLRMLIIMSLTNTDTDIKVNENYKIRTWWEEREEISDYPLDAFNVRENGKEYWKTISLIYNGDTIINYSPTTKDIDNNYSKVVREFYKTIF